MFSVTVSSLNTVTFCGTMPMRRFSAYEVGVIGWPSTRIVPES